MDTARGVFSTQRQKANNHPCMPSALPSYESSRATTGQPSAHTRKSGNVHAHQDGPNPYEQRNNRPEFRTASDRWRTVPFGNVHLDDSGQYRCQKHNFHFSMEYRVVKILGGVCRKHQKAGNNGQRKTDPDPGKKLSVDLASRLTPGCEPQQAQVNKCNPAHSHEDAEIMNNFKD